MSLHHGSNPSISFATFIICSLEFLIYLIGGIIMWKRKELFPLNGRNAVLDIATNFFACLSRFITMLRLIMPDGRPCLLLHSNTLFPELAYTLCLTLRAWTLLFKSELALTIKKDARSNSWYLRNRFLIGNRFIFLFLGAYISVVVVVALVLTAGDSSHVSDRDPCLIDFNSPTIVWESLVYIVTWALIVAIAYRVRHAEEDSYHIKKELRWTGLITAILFILLQTLGVFVSDEDSRYYMLGDFFDAIIFLPVVIANVLVPLYLSFAHSDQKTAYLNRKRMRAAGGSVISSKRPSLHALLLTPDGYDQFLQFLAKEWSTENLLFYKAVERYRQAEEKDRHGIMLEIQEKHVVTNAPFDINIPGLLRTDLLAAIERAKTSSEPPSLEIFDGAYEEIYRLMSSDSYYRFANLVDRGEITFDFSAVRHQEKELSATPDRASFRRDTLPPRPSTEAPLLRPSTDSPGATPRKLSAEEPEAQLDLSPLVEAPQESDDIEQFPQIAISPTSLPSPTSPTSPPSPITYASGDIEVEMTVL